MAKYIKLHGDASCYHYNGYQTFIAEFPKGETYYFIRVKDNVWVLMSGDIKENKFSITNSFTTPQMEKETKRYMKNGADLYALQPSTYFHLRVDDVDDLKYEIETQDFLKDKDIVDAILKGKSNRVPARRTATRRTVTRKPVTRRITARKTTKRY